MVASRLNIIMYNLSAEETHAGCWTMPHTDVLVTVLVLRVEVWVKF